MTTHRTVIAIMTALWVGVVGVYAEPAVEPRFDRTVLTPDFEGQWDGMPTEVVEEDAAQTVVFSQPETEVAVQSGDDDVARPLFVESTLFPSGRTIVFGVAETENADIVLLDNGLDQGFRTGMICEVLNAVGKVGEIILVDVRTDRAAALITQLENDRLIRFGDAVRIKPVTYL